jgi:hypothetical protein
MMTWAERLRDDDRTGKRHANWFDGKAQVE